MFDKPASLRYAARDAAETAPRWASARRVTREWSPDARVSLRSLVHAMRRSPAKANPK